MGFPGAQTSLESPPVLTGPEPSDIIFLYLAVSQNAVSGVLVKRLTKLNNTSTIKARYYLMRKLDIRWPNSLPLPWS